jgi:predicted ATP-binding protein involved in virulence
MNRILNASLFNILKDKETVDINFNSQVTVLTGYNGVGKSTILGSLHSTISLLNSSEYLFPRTDWASRLGVNGDFRINHFKLSNPAAKTIDMGTILKARKEDENLNVIFDFLTEESKSSTKDENVVLSTEGEKRNSKSTNLLYIEKAILRQAKTKRSSTKLSSQPNVKSVLYCDELFSFNNAVDQSEKLDDLDIFSKKKHPRQNAVYFTE